MNYCQFRNDFIKRMAHAGGGILPAEYQQVEYLQSSGTQYIRSGVYDCDSVDAKFQIVTYTNSTVIVGAKSSTSTETNRTGFGELYWSSRHLIIFLCDGSTLSTTEDLNIHTVQMGAVFGWKVYYDGDFIGDYPNQSVTNYECYLYHSQADNTNAKCKIFYARLYANSTLTRDFVPCYRKSDNKPGMYDLVTGTFFTNAGTGEFTVGNDV